MSKLAEIITPATFRITSVIIILILLTGFIVGLIFALEEINLSTAGCPACNSCCIQCPACDSQCAGFDNEEDTCSNLPCSMSSVGFPISGEIFYLSSNITANTVITYNNTLIIPESIQNIPVSVLGISFEDGTIQSDFPILKSMGCSNQGGKYEEPEFFRYNPVNNTINAIGPHGNGATTYFFINTERNINFGSGLTLSPIYIGNGTEQIFYSRYTAFYGGQDPVLDDINAKGMIQLIPDDPTKDIFFLFTIAGSQDRPVNSANKVLQDTFAYAGAIRANGRQPPYDRLSTTTYWVNLLWFPFRSLPVDYTSGDCGSLNN